MQRRTHPLLPMTDTHSSCLLPWMMQCAARPHDSLTLSSCGASAEWPLRTGRSQSQPHSRWDAGLGGGGSGGCGRTLQIALYALFCVAEEVEDSGEVINACCCLAVHGHDLAVFKEIPSLWSSCIQGPLVKLCRKQHPNPMQRLHSHACTT